jgi:alpha-tubulin suppressor-like RCC1 family protein
MFAAGDAQMIQTAKGGNHILLLKDDGTVFAWGGNEYGQLGDGTTTDNPSAAQVGRLTNIKAIAAGGNHSLALTADGKIWAWGLNIYGQLGDNSKSGKTTPVQVQGLTGVVAIAAGENHSVVLKSDGTVWAFGRNNFGQIGDGSSVDRMLPVQVSGLSNITQIAVGSNHNLALRNNNKVFSWGLNDKGQLGNNSMTNSASAVQISGLNNMVSINANDKSSIALSKDNVIWVWGYDRETASIKTSPTSKLLGGTKISSSDNSNSTVSNKMISTRSTGHTLIYGRIESSGYSTYDGSYTDPYDVEVRVYPMDDMYDPNRNITATFDGSARTFTAVARPGDYILEFYRPGYLRRTIAVHVSENSHVTELGIIYLWP